MKNDSNTTENKILEAAEQLFIEQGFDKTTTSQIASLAGCNQALVHYYYRTKEKLFEKIFEEKFRFLVMNMLSITTDGDNFEDTIAKMVGAHFDFLIKNPKLPPFILNEFLTNPARIQTLADKLKTLPATIIDFLDSRLKAEIEKGTIRPISGIDLLLTAVSLNISIFVLNPILKNILNISDEEFDAILLRRRQEVIETLLARLKR